MRRLLFLLLTLISLSVGAQEQVAIATTQHTRPRWVIPNPTNSSNNGCCGSFYLPLNDLGAGAVNTTPSFSLGSGTPTFTRATTAYTTLSTLCQASVASGTARSDYLPSGVYGGYLAEGARTNIGLETAYLYITTNLAVSGGSGSFTDGEGVTATGGGTGFYHAAASTASVFGISAGAGTFTGTLTGNSSLSTRAIGSASAIWTASADAPTVVGNATGADCNANTGWTITDASAGVASNISQAVTLTAAAYTQSVFVKKTTAATTFPVMQAITGTVTALSTINTNTCVPTAWTGYTGDTMLAGIRVYGVQVGTYCWEQLTYTGTAASYTMYWYPAATATGNQSTGIVDVTQTGSAVVWNPQVELSAFASTPMPTTTVAVTRNADVLTYPSAGNIGSIGSAYAEVVVPVANPSGINVGIIGDGGAGNYIPIFINTTTNKFAIFDGNSGTDFSSAQTFPLNTVQKVASVWGNSLKGGTLDGATVITGAYNNTMTPTSIEIGGYNMVSQLFGTIRNVILWETALSAPYLQTKTTDATDWLGDPFWNVAANDDTYRLRANQ